MILTSVQLLYLSVSTSAYPSDASSMVVQKERSSNHITCQTHQRNQLLNSPSTSTSFSVSSPFCIRGEITQRSSSPNGKIETDEDKNNSNFKRSASATPKHHPSKKSNDHLHLHITKKTYKKVGDRDLKIDALIFWDVKNSVPINHGAIDFWTRWHWSSQRWQWLFFLQLLWLQAAQHWLGEFEDRLLPC